MAKLTPATLLLHPPRRRHRKITANMQVVMWFAGLRGAIAFALSTGMPGASKDVYASTTLMVVIFTTIGCGGLTEPLLHRMNVKIQVLCAGGSSIFFSSLSRRLSSRGTYCRAWEHPGKPSEVSALRYEIVPHCFCCMRLITIPLLYDACFLCRSAREHSTWGDRGYHLPAAFGI